MDGNEQPKPANLFWHRLHASRNELIPKILDHAAKTFGVAAIDEAWSEFHGWNDEPFDPKSPELQVFMPWFFYNWTVDIGETDVLDSAPKDVPPALSLLNRRGAFLEPLQREYIEACLSAPFSFFEVASCHPGQGFQLNDIFSGEILDVVEKMGSENAGIGDIFFGKAVTVQGLTTMEATSSILIPPIYKAPLLKIRKTMERHYKSITPEVLREYDIELIEQYQDYREQLLNPQMPILSNSDGDPFVPQKVFFEIVSPQDAFEALKDLNFAETAEDLLQDAEFGDDKKLMRIQLAWLKKGNKKNKGWDNTVLGHITIDRSSLMVDVNSEKRAKLFRRLVTKRLGVQARYKTTLIEAIEPALKRKARQAEEESDTSANFEDPKMLMAEDPGLVGELTKIIAAHWDGWIHEKVPALGNKTPIQAAKSKDGKEMLIALLTQFEREAVNHPQVGVTVQTFKKIRDQLGLSDTTDKHSYPQRR